MIFVKKNWALGVDIERFTCMTASITRQTLVFIRPKLVITSSLRPSSRMVCRAGQNSCRRIHLEMFWK